MFRCACVVHTVFYVCIAHGGLQTPVNQSLGQWPILAPSLQEDINNLNRVMAPDDPPSTKANVRTLSLSIPAEETLKAPDGKRVSLLRLIEYAYPPNMKHAQKRSGGLYIALSHEAGCDLYKPDHKHLERWKRSRRLLPKYGAVLDNVFYFPTMGKAPQLIQERHFHLLPTIVSEGIIPVIMEDFYTDKEKQFNDWHRPIVAKILVDALNNEPTLLQNAQKHGAYLFALGCGSGCDLNSMSEKLKEEGVHNTGYGLEIYSSLVEKAKLQYPHLNFINTDASHPAVEIAKAIKANSLTPESPVIVLAESFLTRYVLPGTEAGLAVLQELLQEGIADLVVISGQAAPLVNARMAQAAGWIAYPLMIYYPENKIASDIYIPALVLRRPVGAAYLDSFFENCRNNIMNYMGDVVDMSMSATPWLLVRSISEQLEVGEVKKIDLSFSYLPKDRCSVLIDEIISHLNSLPALTQVILSGREHWYKEFMDKSIMSGRYTIALRDDMSFDHELPVLDAVLRDVLLKKRYPDVKYTSK